MSLSYLNIHFTGLGSLLLKNLRFRDLENIYDGDNDDDDVAEEEYPGKDSTLSGRFDNSFYNSKKLAIISGNKNGKEYPITIRLWNSVILNSSFSLSSILYHIWSNYKIYYTSLCFFLSCNPLGISLHNDTDFT